MKKIFKLLVALVLAGLIVLAACKLFCKQDKSDSSTTTKYYSYEKDGKFIMSSTAHKVEDLKQIDNKYYIKENITKTKSKEKIVEVLYNDFSGEPYLYGYYTNSDFNKYFSEQIKNGLTCDNKTEVAYGEGSNIKCLIHDEGFEYEKIDSELCVNIDDNEVCVKPNAWEDVDKYKDNFEKAGWVCEYHDYDSGKWTNSKKPTDGVMECSKVKPSERTNSGNDLYCYIGTDGETTCNDGNGWCNINSDLTTNCYGTD